MCTRFILTVIKRQPRVVHYGHYTSFARKNRKYVSSQVIIRLDLEGIHRHDALCELRHHVTARQNTKYLMSTTDGKLCCFRSAIATEESKTKKKKKRKQKSDDLSVVSCARVVWISEYECIEWDEKRKNLIYVFRKFAHSKSNYNDSNINGNGNGSNVSNSTPRIFFNVVDHYFSEMCELQIPVPATHFKL